MILKSAVKKQADAPADFDALANIVSNVEASLILFCLTDETAPSKEWMLISFIPDECRVRDKMLYAGSKEDLKKALGSSYFRSDYSTSSKDELTWAMFTKSSDKTVSNDILSDRERLIDLERTLIHAESNDLKSTAMGVLPFNMTTDTDQAFKDFNSGAKNFIELTVRSEVITLISSNIVKSGDKLQSLVSATEPTFYMIHLDNKRLFVFSCPENAQVRLKMTMAASRASVLASASKEGITFDTTIGISSPEEIDALFSETPDSVFSPVAANITHSKPKAPGRAVNKTKAKFIADSD